MARWERIFNYVAHFMDGHVECLRCEWKHNDVKFNEEGAKIIATHVYDEHAMGDGGIDE